MLHPGNEGVGLGGLNYPRPTGVCTGKAWNRFFGYWSRCNDDGNLDDGRRCLDDYDLHWRRGHIPQRLARGKDVETR